MDETERRQALASFLRTRRARLGPADVGLPAGRRRRTTGLRREEVAELASIGVSWYTLLEQGQDVHPSEEVLASLAQALQLTAAERRHLFFLARPERTPFDDPDEALVTAALHHLLAALDPHPAFVLGRSWDVLSWNRAADVVFHFQEPCPPHSRNAVWRFFMMSHELWQNSDWETQAESMVAYLRADYIRSPGNAALEVVVEDLQRVSSQFRLWWERQDVHGVPNGKRSMHHSILGSLEFEHMTLQVPSAPDLHVKTYVASPETVRKLEGALREALPQ
jgi:transcriptional regulator with XRE-family HTH domain